jgi:DedD protein
MISRHCSRLGEGLILVFALSSPACDDEAADTPADTTDNTPAAVAHVEVQPRDFQDALQGDQVAPPAADADLAGVLPPAASTSDPPAEPVLSAASLAPPSAPAGSGCYVVQVASFGSVATAERLSATLRGHGYGVLADTVQSDVGTLHRVRIGPYASEAEANAAAARVSKQVPEVKPRVVDLQPEAAAQVTTPADPLVRWIVQVGSFAAADNADKLVERLRGEGLSAYREAVSSAGSTIYRVRVGPFLERDEAIRVDGLIGERLSLDGVVMSAD